MNERLAVGVDIGGTKIAFALVDEGGSVRATHRLPTDPDAGPSAVLDRVAEGVRVLLDHAPQPVAGVGVGCPGHVNPASGVVRTAINLGWTEVALREELARRLPPGLPVWIDKDANAGALGELYFGAARGCTDFVYIAVGTGLGGGAVVRGEVVSGANAFAMEIGHLALDPAGRACRCGLRGCPETVVSGVGLLAGVAEHRASYPDSPLVQMDGITTAAILEAARAGDPLALVVLDEAAACLGAVCATCASVLNPALIVIGGGLGRAARDFLLEGAERELRRRVLPPASEQVRLVESRVTASAVGAACLVWQG